MINLISFILIVIIFVLLKYIKKNVSSLPVFLIYFQIIFTSSTKFFIGYLSLPSFINYFNDVILIFILLLYLLDKKKKNFKIEHSSLKNFIIIYFIVCLFSFILNLYSPLLFLWGFRNNFRFLIFAYLCTYFVKKNDLKLLFPILTTLLIMNFIVVLYQFFFINFNSISKGDFISGLYSNGFERGGNSSLCWLLCIGCTYTLTNYLYRKISIKYLLLWFILSLLICSLNETKIFFIEIALISIVTILLCKKSLKTFVFIMIGLFAFAGGIKILYILFPTFNNFFNLNNIYLYFEGSYSGSNLSRSNAISYMLNNFLNGNMEKLFGIGLGNADFSAFDMFTSSFYLKYHSSLLYSFFSSSMIVIETGILGLTSFLLIFVDCLRKNYKKYLKEFDKRWYIIAISVSIISLISFFANQSLRIESIAYLIFFIIAIVYNNSLNEVKNSEK